VRLALGASRARAAWHVMAESLVVSLTGGVAGVGLAMLGARALRAFGPADLPRLDELSIDPGAMALTAVVAVAVGVIAGAAPALRGARVDLAESLKQTGRTTDGRGGLRLRSALVVAQVALSVMLLVGSGLLIRSFIRLQRVDSGLAVENLLLASVQLPGAESDTLEKRALFYEQLQERLRAIPGVADVGASEQLPMLAGGMWNYVSPGDRPIPPPEGRTRGTRRRASESLFRTLGIPIVRGRAFDARDKVGSQPVAIINQTLAARFWPEESAVGKTLVLGSGDGPPLEIVGVARDVREFGPDSQDEAVFYLSFAQFPTQTAQIAIRTRGDPVALTGQVKSALLELNRNVPIWSFHTMESRLADRIAEPRFRTQLLGVFAMIALVMAATGLYGVLAFFVAQRMHELGIRLALGATGRDVMRLVVKRGMGLAGIGIGAGVLGGLAVTRLMQSLLFQTTASDPTTFVIVSGCLALVALLACAVPAWRARAVDPLIALRTE
jgi:putative ABC transport system permease protein